MIVCDAIHRDPGTGKFTILGTFSNIFAHSYPATHAQLFLYVALTDGRGKVPINVVLVDVEEQQPPLFTGDIEIEFPDPRAVHELALPVPLLRIPAKGEYRFQLRAGGELLMERRIIAVQVGDGGDENG